MSSYRPKNPRMAWLAIVVVLALLAGCTTPPPVTPQPRPTATKPPASGEFICDPAGGKLEPIKALTGSHYVLNQVIITGPAGGVEEVINQLGGKEAGFAPIQTCYLRHLLPDQPAVERWSESSNSRGSVQHVEFTPEERANLATSLISTPSTMTTEDAIAQVRKVASEYRVFVDPNYLTGPLQDANPISPCGVAPDPEIGGAPFEVGGSPFEVGGSPFEVGGSSGGLGADADPAIFWPQWAFKQIGLESDGSGRGRWTGKGVAVAVFDTSPYSRGAQAWVRDQNVDLELALVFPPLVNELTPTPTQPDGMPPVTVADHGLFAAGLVYAVAPDSTIHLVRVLNDYGCGDLWTLNNAINEFASRQAQQGRLDHVVLNLSLGVHQPRDLDKLGWPAQIVSLDKALLNAYEHGAVIVAASGNDSYASLKPRPMQLPADWDYVIGVAASNQTPEPACYSNLGDVAASGADGRRSAREACQPRAHECAIDEADCPLGLVSLATQSKTGYRFWVGTSFAAPLVSGQAALLLSSGLQIPEVQRCILGTATRFGDLDVANVDASVRRCTPAPSQ